jgi:hypothetical protein
MTGKKTAVFGIYHNANQAERVVDRLREEGFSNDDISVLLQDNQGSKDFAHARRTQKRRRAPPPALRPAG